MLTITHDRMPPSSREAHGFTLIEVVIALAILTVALLGVAGAVAVQSGGIAVSLPLGQAAVTRGHHVSTATFLAHERLEQVRRLQYRIGPPALDEIGAGAPPTALPDEDFGTIAGFPDFRREVTVQDAVPGESLKTVGVTVKFALPGGAGIALESISMSTIVAARP